MGQMGGALQTMFSLGMSQPSAGRVKVDNDKFNNTADDRKGLDPNRSAAAAAAKERRQRLLAAKGRQGMRVDMSPQMLGGSGVSIRGRKEA
jgi:hypothetical protein